MAFTKKITDLSSDKGYQFEFHCDKCDKGVRTGLITSSMDISTGLLGAASSLFGGFSAAGENLKKKIGGEHNEHAFAAAINEIKPKFTERGGLWLCKDCAAAPAQTSACACGAPLTGSKFCGACGKPAAIAAPCSKCKAEIPAAAKFCPECGTPAPSATS